MLNLAELPESVITWFDRNRPGWREPFENPPSFFKRIVRLTITGDKSISLLLDCGHTKVIDSRQITKATKRQYVTGAEAYCDVCSNSYNPVIERRIHVEVAS